MGLFTCLPGRVPSQRQLNKLVYSLQPNIMLFSDAGNRRRQLLGSGGSEHFRYLDVPADGIYTFALLSDDSSTMEVDGKLILDNDGGHSPKEITSQMALSKGLHPVKILYFDHNGGTLKMSTYNDQDDKIECPAEWLKH